MGQKRFYLLQIYTQTFISLPMKRMKEYEMERSSLISSPVIPLPLSSSFRPLHVFLSPIESLTHSFFLSQNLTINYFLHNQSTSARINKRNVIANPSLSFLRHSSLLSSIRIESRIEKRDFNE